MGSLSFEEYFPCAEELAQLEKNEPALYETYKELMCYYYIFLDLHPSRGTVISLTSWVEYSFPVVDGLVKDLQAPMSEKKIVKAMKVGNHEDVVMEEDGNEYERGDVFLSFHRQAFRPLSQQVLLAGYLSAWLKRCVVPSAPLTTSRLWQFFHLFS